MEPLAPKTLCELQRGSPLEFPAPPGETLCMPSKVTERIGSITRHSSILERPITIELSRVAGVWDGIALGDALGLPVETFSAERIRSEIGPIRSFLSNEHNPFLAGKNVPPASTSDDLQLTMAVLRAVTKGLDTDQNIMDLIASEHIEALHRSDTGWGASTREAVEKLAHGTHWQDSGQTNNERRGLGNGIPMKIAPLALFIFVKQLPVDEIVKLVTEFAGMTHRTEMAVSAGLAHVAAVTYCLGTSPDKFDRDEFISLVTKWSAKAADNTAFPQQSDDLTARLKRLHQMIAESPQTVIQEFGGGSCYVYDSLPFSYYFFLSNPHSLDALLHTVESGGDTDSNGAMVGSLLGALHGENLPGDCLYSLGEFARQVREWPEVKECHQAFCVEVARPQSPLVG